MTTATRTTGGPGWLVRWLAALPVGGSLVLSFAGLAELAGASRVAGPLVYLWPLSLDAAGAVASLVWLDRRLPVEARRAARWLALVTIVLSVAGNSLWHWLIELAQRPHVGVQMAVGAVPPLVLFAMLHVLVLAHGDHRDQPTASQPPRQARPRARLPISQRDVVLITRVTARRAVGPGGVLALPPTSGQLADQPARLASPPPASHPPASHPPASQTASRPAASPASQPAGVWTQHIDRARELLTERPGIGRPALAAELGVPESQARQLKTHLAGHRTALLETT